MARRKSIGVCTCCVMWMAFIVAMYAYYEVIWNPPTIAPAPKSKFVRSDDFRPAKCRRIPQSEMVAVANDAKTLTLLARDNAEDMLTPHHIGKRECYFVVNVSPPNTAAVYAAYLNPEYGEVRDFFRADHRDRLCGRRRLRHRFPKQISWNWTNPLTLQPAANRTTAIYLATRIASAFHLLEGKDICE